MKTKKRVLITVASLGLFFIAFQISGSSTSRFLNNAAFPAKIRETTREESKLISEQIFTDLPESPIVCDRTSIRYDLCSINGPTVLDSATSTFFTMNSTGPPLMEIIRPYPRKFEDLIMAHIKNLTLTVGPRIPSCRVQHDAPALVFTAGGYTGNFWHDFNDGFVPLFITANTIFPDQDFVIVVSEAPKWWPSKYADLLRTFTNHPIINLGSDTTTHCFPSAKIGLISHGFMIINQTMIPNSKTYLNFRGLLSKAFSQQAQVQIITPKLTKPRPLLVLASRRHATGRSIMNQAQVIRLIKKVGFDVVVFEPKTKTPLQESYALLNSSHAFVGVHGAALTHSLFLRPGAVFVQVVPIGIGWAAEAFFGRVAMGLNLEYFEYKIEVEESTLKDKYGKDSLLVRDPFALLKTGWPPEVMDIYLKEQNVKLDLVRFKRYLKKTFKKATRFMENNG
ncbi:xylan glycosyltransferase MUCI21-like [Argentina anserina]|uniref:xylan glycosyltransferase MUCI21-like n=1 Tax=Argentina anserina TaxID=57926 RepID=UPI002176951E|nr:xylan glycosyltransferase MUCI21-like [Potentilla anserina]